MDFPNFVSRKPRNSDTVSLVLIVLLYVQGAAWP